LFYKKNERVADATLSYMMNIRLLKGDNLNDASILKYNS